MRIILKCNSEMKLFCHNAKNNVNYEIDESIPNIGFSSLLSCSFTDF